LSPVEIELNVVGLDLIILIASFSAFGGEASETHRFCRHSFEVCFLVFSILFEKGSVESDAT